MFNVFVKYRYRKLVQFFRRSLKSGIFDITKMLRDKRLEDSIFLFFDKSIKDLEKEGGFEEVFLCKDA